MKKGAAGVSKKSYAGDDRGIPPFKKEGWGTRQGIASLRASNKTPASSPAQSSAPI